MFIDLTLRIINLSNLIMTHRTLVCTMHYFRGGDKNDRNATVLFYYREHDGDCLHRVGKRQRETITSRQRPPHTMMRSQFLHKHTHHNYVVALVRLHVRLFVTLSMVTRLMIGSGSIGQSASLPLATKLPLFLALFFQASTLLERKTDSCYFVDLWIGVPT